MSVHPKREKNVSYLVLRDREKERRLFRLKLLPDGHLIACLVNNFLDLELSCGCQFVV